MLCHSLIVGWVAVAESSMPRPGLPKASAPATPERFGLVWRAVQTRPEKQPTGVNNNKYCALGEGMMDHRELLWWS